MNVTQSPSPVRVRFAPSPTGYLHVGGARTLLFNWLYAQKMSGTLVLRVEDTDQARSTRDHEKTLLEDISRLGIQYAEGVQIGGQVGPYGPYRQSERLSIYSDHARRLLNEDKAYYCFCSDDELTRKREAALKLGRPPHYDGTCARLPRAEAEARLARGDGAGLRFRSLNESMVLEDAVRGRVEFKAGTVGDFFITRTPTAEEKKRPELAGVGMPVYNFCCVIDDALMKITHVIRGEDHLSNTSRQLMIYQALGYPTPVFAHTASVLGNDRLKLSKRSGDTSVFDYLNKGYLPDALLNFLVLLGFGIKADTPSKAGHPEIFSREELVAIFNLESLQKAPAVFDKQKLDWMNAFYIRHLDLDRLAVLAEPFFVQAQALPFAPGSEQARAWLKAICAAVRSEVTLLGELPGAAAGFIGGVPEVEPDARAMLVDPASRAVIDALSAGLQALPEQLSATDIDGLAKNVGLGAGAKGKALFMPMRAALTGKTHGPELKQILPILGRTKTLDRMRQILAIAGVNA